MFIPFTQLATVLSLFVSSQISLPAISRAWVSPPVAHRCSSASHDHWGEKSVPAKRKVAAGRGASSDIQILSFGP